MNSALPGTAESHRSKRTGTIIQLKHRPVDVLLVADDVDSVRQIRHALHQTKVVNRLHHVGDGVEATAYLRREGQYRDAPDPELVLLDANLPRKCQFDVVAELTTEQQFAEISMIVLASSESELRLTDECGYAADGSISMPLSLPQLVQSLMSVDTSSVPLAQSAPAV